MFTFVCKLHKFVALVQENCTWHKIKNHLASLGTHSIMICKREIFILYTMWKSDIRNACYQVINLFEDVIKLLFSPYVCIEGCIEGSMSVCFVVDCILHSRLWYIIMYVICKGNRSVFTNERKDTGVHASNQMKYGDQGSSLDSK